METDAILLFCLHLSPVIETNDIVWGNIYRLGVMRIEMQRVLKEQQAILFGHLQFKVLHSSSTVGEDHSPG